MTPTQLTEIITAYLIRALYDFDGDIDTLSANLAKRICEQQTPYVLDDPITITADDAELVEKARKAVEQMQESLKKTAHRLAYLFHDQDEFNGVARVSQAYLDSLSEIERLQSVIAQHNLCHDLHGKVNCEDFAKGCAAEIKRIYGRCPWEEEIERLKAAISDRNLT